MTLADKLLRVNWPMRISIKPLWEILEGLLVFMQRRGGGGGDVSASQNRT